MLDSLPTGFSYDSRGQLTETCFGACPGQPAVPQLPCLACVGNSLTRPAATAPNAADKFIRYTYDAIGNRLTEATYLGTTTSAYDAGDRLTTVTAPGGAVTNYTYDANGNQTAAGARTYTYDAADRMASARIGTTTESYTWSGDGLRLSASTGTQAAKTTRYVWDRNFGLAQLAIERNGSGTTLRSYAYALDLLSQTAGASTFYYHHDGLGSVADVTGSTGTSLAWYEYKPFGDLRQSAAANSAPVNPFRFTGEQLDSFTGLYHLRARQYDPGSGRFLSQDPVAPTLEDPYVASYVYVGNSPTNGIDPSGEIGLFGLVGGFVGGVIAYGAGTVVGNALAGRSFTSGLNVADALLAGGSGAVMAATGGMSLIWQATAGMATSVGTTATSMALDGRTDPRELAWAVLFGVAGPLLDAVPVPALRALPLREQTVAFGRGVLTSVFLTAGQGGVATSASGGRQVGSSAFGRGAVLAGSGSGK